jgi:hypothetical protein
MPKRPKTEGGQGAQAKPAGKRRRTPAAAKPTRKVTKPSPSATRFVADLLTRGEAAERDAKGRLPRRATHEVTKRNPDGTAEVKRVRFKLF